MCGIAGFVIAPGCAVESGILQNMTSALEHRGPDDSGYFAAMTNDGYSVGLGNRRLSIIDLPGGHQPIGNEDGRIQVVFNGEIYNFEELRRVLADHGHHFATRSDTEVIVHAYEQYGEACVEKLDGMFAFALWDSRCDTLLLARDRFGKKPLFIYSHGDSVLFASEIKSLLCHPSVAAQPDLEAIRDYLIYRYVPGPSTLYAGIRKQPPGSLLIWNRGKTRQERFYTPPDRNARDSNGVPFSDVVTVFGKVLGEAVRKRMISDVPFGAFLSGGIDSSTIVALMSRHSSLPIRTFSVGFSDPGYSELQHARVVARQFRTDHHELIVSEQDVIDLLPHLVGCRDAPISEPSDVPIYLLAREARRHVKMVLTGEGSDEILGGYPKHVCERFVRPYQRLPRAFRTLLLEPLVNALPYRFRKAKTAVRALGLEVWDERMPAWFGAMSPSACDRLLRQPRETALQPRGGHLDSHPRNTALRRILYFDQTSWLPDNLLERGDGMTMAASLEARMPFLDAKLVAFVSGLPDRFRVRGFTTKWILRRTMKGLLPASTLQRTKVGFRVPVNVWFRGPMKDYLCDQLGSSSSRTRQYYRVDQLDRLMTEHLSGRQNHEKLLWTLLNLEVWHRECLEKPRCGNKSKPQQSEGLVRLWTTR
jgi:asparagine synthase (glutamine-hydrolysing)